MELTAQRLTQLLGRRVQDFVVEPLGVFSSKVSRLSVAMIDAAQPVNFIIKEPHPERGDRIGESFVLEAQFYEQVAPTLTIRLPRCHAHAEDFILLEDVEGLPFSWQRGATRAHAHAAMRTLAELHGSAAEPPAWVPAFADPDFRFALTGRFAESWEKNREALCRWCPAFGSIGDYLQPRLSEYYAALADPGVLLHGDAHLENIPMIADTDDVPRVVCLDWQGPRRGHPLFDVAYFNVMSFPVDARREQEAALLQTYLAGKPTPAETRAYRHAVAARASGIVEMTADWSHEQIDQPAMGWVINRCFSAAVDHRVETLLD